MRRFLAAFAMCLIGTVSFAQSEIRPLRFPVRHADPWMIKALLEGAPIMSPELSAIWILAGQPQIPAGVNALFSGGTWVVNPTDNSLWWFPDRR